ncbi:MAG: 30S ribosomal protein S15 [Leptospiraceae bacterium]|nr:30S ribosomal protein S15 [Leptospiraceae bacterium]MCP5513236.1 30S ribosomal protein S15 [Leptospiraceae bacterium]
MITKENKTTIIQDHQKHNSDTGSAEVQISLINARINDLNIHFKANKKDHQSRRGLLKLVSQRKRLLNYLKKSDLNRYRNLIQKLGLRK